jgi:ribosome silencing factor RsfS/YbeB/iojap
MNVSIKCTTSMRASVRARLAATSQRPCTFLHGSTARSVLALRTARASVDDIEEDQLEYGREIEDASPMPSVDQVEEDEETKNFALALAKVAWELKGEDLLLLHVAPVVYWTRYMLFVTVFSRPQLQAVLGKIEKTAMEEFDMKSSGGTKSSSWELLDFGSTVVHVMTADEREYYDLESFYAAADEVPLPFDDEARQNLDWRSKM